MFTKLSTHRVDNSLPIIIANMMVGNNTPFTVFRLPLLGKQGAA